MEKQVYSVGEITHYIKHLLEENNHLKGVSISGEVSNITYHRSGHVYFSIKDPQATMSCVMFKGYAQYAVRMKDGDKVVVKGNMSVYAPRGNYQLMVQSVKKQGLGDLYQQFLVMKGKLEKEGLFDEDHKQDIPLIPSKIVVLTSATGAAIRDILQTLKRRYNRGEVVLIPTVVQGSFGAASIVKNLQIADELEADVVILARGGGSIEDLWNFNEEEVARAVYEMKTPVVSGVGHESDFTIVDFVADLRASTPTAAAEKVAPDLSAIQHTLDEYSNQLVRSLQHFVDFKRQVLDDYESRLKESVQRGTLEKGHELAQLQQGMEQQIKRSLQEKVFQLSQYKQELKEGVHKGLKEARHELDLMATKLKGMDVSHVLKQGYTLTLKEGKVLKNVDKLKEGEEIETVFEKGRTTSTLTKIQNNE